MAGVRAAPVPAILGALLDAVSAWLADAARRAPRSAAADGRLRALGRGLRNRAWPAGTFARAYEANRRAAIEDAIDADPVAACVREIMAERSSWTGSAADLLRAGAGRSSDGISRSRTGWPKNPRALAGRLRRAQTFLRALGIDIAFSREGRAGSRVIRIRATHETTVSTVSSVRHNGSQSGSGQPPPAPTGAVPRDHCRADLAGRGPAEACPSRSQTMLTVLTQMSAFVAGVPYLHWALGREAQRDLRWRRSKSSLIRANGLQPLNVSCPRSSTTICTRNTLRRSLRKYFRTTFRKTKLKKRRYSRAPAPATQEAPHLMTMDRYGQPCDAVILRSEAWS